MLIRIILIISISLTSAYGLSCWKCENAQSNEECLRNGTVQQCVGKNMNCQNTVRSRNGRVTIHKECKQRRACINNMRQNGPLTAIYEPVQCTFEPGNIVCRCCCRRSKCNDKALFCRGSFQEQQVELKIDPGLDSSEAYVPPIVPVDPGMAAISGGFSSGIAGSAGSGAAGIPGISGGGAGTAGVPGISGGGTGTAGISGITGGGAGTAGIPGISGGGAGMSNDIISTLISIRANLGIPGRSSGGQTIIDIDECAGHNNGMGNCLNAHACINTPGSFLCECKRGWTGLLCEQNIAEYASMGIGTDSVNSNSILSSIPVAP